MEKRKQSTLTDEGRHRRFKEIYRNNFFKRMKRERIKPKQWNKTNNNTTIQEILSEIKEDLKVCIYINSRTFQRRKE